MKEKLADMIFLSIRETRSIEELAERLVDRGVQIVPDGAMILTRAELDALNKYQERFKGQDAEAVIATEVAREIFEEIKKFLSPYRYPIIADLEKKYTESEKNNV